MTTKRILVSGATGFIGQAVTRELVKKGHSVRALTRSAQKGKACFPSGSVETVEGDITRPETLADVCSQIDIAIQCAQFPGHPVENKRKHYTYFEVDALGTENLAKATQSAKVKHFIYISGAGTDGRRTEPWFKAKWYAELAIHGAGLPATILRPSWVYGPGDQSLNRLLKIARFCPIVPLIGSGKNRVQPIFVEDLAQIVSNCTENAGEVDRWFDVGGPEEMTMREMLRRAFAVIGKKTFLLPVPKNLMKLAAFPLQFLPNPPLNPKAVDFVTMDVSIDIVPLQKAFPQLRLRTLEEGLKSYL